MNIGNRKGSVIVETAIIIPILLFILSGIFEYGRFMYMTNALNNAAREGARRAAVSPPPIDINAFVMSVIPFTFNEAELHIITDPPAPAPGSGVPVKVTVTLPFTALIKTIPELPLPANLKGEAAMRYEYVGI